ncbi:putative phage head protein [Pseudomonas sp. zfem003]|uniref:putative phage head protein n=1 Tax=Pseudomonas sp. zfem003 TaxID=3078198 RepID=UPI002928266A|nr:putative phage head protein [Pseudomonas sp. zfem003]MDU9399298.1 putative phage head protein [Pseudomonas sp. zfem003]
MCFGSKVKTPKVNTNPPAPEPVLEEEPKGIDFGGEESGSESASDDDKSTGKITKIEREGESTDVPSALSTASSSKRKKSTMSSSAVRKSLTKQSGAQ